MVSFATRLLLMASLLVLPGIASAHHSFALYYDSSKIVTLTGVVSRYAYKNPHIEIDVTVKEGAKSTKWKVETLNARLAATYDLKATSLKVGDPVVIKGWPAKDGSRTLGGHQLVLSDGRIFMLRRAPRTSPVRFRSIHGFTGEKSKQTPRELLSGKPAKSKPTDKPKPRPDLPGDNNPKDKPGEEEESPQSEFIEQMEEASFAIAALKELLTDNKSPEGQLEEIENLQAAMFNAKALIPHITLSETALKNSQGDAKAVRKAMKENLFQAIRLTLSNEEDIESGRIKAALAGVEALIKSQETAHKQFQ